MVSITGRPVNPRISKREGLLRLTFPFFLLAALLAPSEGFSQWAEPIVAHSTTIKASHVVELRTQVNAKLAVCGQPPQAWTNVTLTPRLTTIKKVDLDELRTATTNLVNASRIQQALPPSPPAYAEPIVVRTTTVKAAHINELRGYIAGATCTPGCPAQVLAWTVGADACSAAAPLTAIGSMAVISDIVALATGVARFICNAGGVWAAAPNPGATCSAIPGCGPGINWDTGTEGYSGSGACSAPLIGPVVDNGAPGAAIVVTNTAPGYTGTATARCHDTDPLFGTVAAEWLISGATCTPVCGWNTVGPIFVSFADDAASNPRCDAIYNGIGTWCTTPAENGQVAKCLDGGGGICDATGCSDGFTHTCSCP